MPRAVGFAKAILTRRKQFINIVSAFCWWIWGTFQYASCSRIKLWPFPQACRPKLSHLMVVFSLNLPHIYDFSTSFWEGWRAGNASQLPRVPVGGRQMSDHMLILDIRSLVVHWVTVGRKTDVCSSKSCTVLFLAEFCVLLWVLTLPCWNGDNVMVLGQEQRTMQIWWQEKRKGNSLSLMENKGQWTA